MVALLCDMDVSREPLLNDEDRRKAFFSVLPEHFVSEFLNELATKRYFLYSRINTLEAYRMLVVRDSFQFERGAYRDVSEDFKESFETLLEFTEDQMLVDDNSLSVRLSSSNVRDEHTQKLEIKLDDLCYEVADRYKRVVAIFSKESIKHEPVSSIVKTGNTLWLGRKSYTVRSKRAKGVLSVLWDERVKKKDVKKAHWVGPANTAFAMGLVKSSQDYTQDVWKQIDETRKSMNRRMEDNGIKAEIVTNESSELLFVLSE